MINNCEDIKPSCNMSDVRFYLNLIEFVYTSTGSKFVVMRGTLGFGPYINVSWWRHQMETFCALLTICAGNSHRSPVNSPHKGQWRRALMFSLICAWINGWVNNREAGDLRRHRANYDVIVMSCMCTHTCDWLSGQVILEIPPALPITIPLADNNSLKMAQTNGISGSITSLPTIHWVVFIQPFAWG